MHTVHVMEAPQDAEAAPEQMSLEQRPAEAEERAEAAQQQQQEESAAPPPSTQTVLVDVVQHVSVCVCVIVHVVTPLRVEAAVP